MTHQDNRYLNHDQTHDRGQYRSQPTTTPAGGDAPMVEPGPPSAQKQAETCSFDSAHNNLLPGLVPALADNQVTEVACGGGHLIALSITRPPAPVVPNAPTVDPALIAKVNERYWTGIMDWEALGLEFGLGLGLVFPRTSNSTPVSHPVSR
jgi:hypothetical protein